MEFVRGFFDYSISEQCLTNGSFDNIAKRLLELGYHTIAINQTLDETCVEPKKKKKKGESREIVELVPIPCDIKLKEEYKELKVLNRLTITFANQEYLHKITKSLNYKKYHIIAVCPTTQAAFQFVCGNLEADILTFNAVNKPLYRLNRKLYNQLINRRYHFEILYSPAILDSTKRKNTIYTSHLYHTYGRGLIFGLNQQQSKQAIMYNCKNVYVNSVGRRHGRAVMFLEDVAKEQGVNEREGVNINDRIDDDEEEMEIDQPVQKKSKQ